MVDPRLRASHPDPIAIDVAGDFAEQGEDHYIVGFEEGDTGVLI